MSGRGHHQNRDNRDEISENLQDNADLAGYGNRNPQGLALHPVTGDIWETEHGPMGGDELNVLEKGANYGWPPVTFGRNYNGTEVSALTEMPGTELPVVQWTPSIAACPAEFYIGDLFPE